MPRIKYYNKNTNQWEYADSQYTIGGSANGESGVLCVTVLENSDREFRADKTAEDVYTAFMAGKGVVCNVHGFDWNYSLPLLVAGSGIVIFGCAIYDTMLLIKINDVEGTVEAQYEELITDNVWAELEEWAENLIDNKLIGVVKSVNGITPDANGNVQFSIPDSEDTDVFWVTAAYDPMKNETTCNLTPDEIYRAATGKSVICELNNDGIKIRMVPAAILPHVSVFYTYAPYSTECWLATLVIQENAAQYVETALVTEENIVEAVTTVMAQAGVKTESEINEMIDTKLAGFVPDSGGDVDLAITGAEVGQTVRIAEVDENGVPTAWEAVEFPSGGGGSEWRHIRTVTIPTDASTDTSGVSFAEKTGSGSTDYIFAFDTDKNGKPFELSELFVKYNAGTTFDGTGSGRATFGMAIVSTPNTQGSNAIDAEVQLKSGTKVGWFEIRYIDGNISYLSTWNMGGGANEVRGARDFVLTGKEKGWIIALCLNLTNNLSKYGFCPGSVFEIYGR